MRTMRARKPDLHVQLLGLVLSLRAGQGYSFNCDGV
jgi:hypothetical protein